MPINNQMRPQQINVSDDDQKLSRPGGAASKGSTPIQADPGSRLAKMTSLLLGQKDLDSQDVKKLAGGSAGKQRQFGTLASTGKTPAKKGKIFRIPK